MPSLERNLDDVVKALRAARDRGRGASLLIGAGCSVTAGIPLAAGFVNEIVRDYGHRIENLPEKTYPHCMAELAPNERNDIIAPHIDKASINWAHMAIAQLMKQGFVSRILTTNFDPLVVKACAMVGVFPAVYDLAASQTFKADRVYEPAVFYLHGQRSGFVALHTKDEVAQHKAAVAPVFEDAGKGRVWVVCGYSGDNDPVFDHLAEVTSFGYNLYWAGFRDADPAEHVRTRLLTGGKYAFYVRGYDADTFFVELARRLDCFPPALIAKPFSHLLEMTALLSPFTIGTSTADLREAARTRIQAAIERFEIGDASHPASADLPAEALDANTLLLSGKYYEVLALFEKTTDPSDELRDAAAWALIAQGDDLTERARSAGDDERAEALWNEGFGKYAAALQISPGKHEALNNWGSALVKRAKTKAGDQADALLREACDKYAAAASDGRADELVHYNWGTALAARARRARGDAADQLWSAAYGQFAEAVRMKPEYDAPLYNWGVGLLHQAETKAGAEADQLLREACEKYAAAVQINPNKQQALNNWGTALCREATRKIGAEADALLREACDKYAAAARIRPDEPEVLNNWGNALLRQAAIAPAGQKEELFAAAAEKLSRADEIVPGPASYNLACLAALRGDAESCRHWLLHSKEHGTLPAREHILSDSDLAAVRDAPWFEELVGAEH